MVQHGSTEGLPPVPNWTSLNKGPVEMRRAFYHGLAAAFAIPGVDVALDATRQDKHARGADYIGRYPGVLVEAPPPAMSPFVRFEVGRARVAPFVEMPLSSFVHEHLERQGLMADYIDNRPHAVRCVHPLVTLLEKLDAMSRRYTRDLLEPDTFVRHYEDAAQIVRRMDQLPAIESTPVALAEDMVAQRDIVALPSADDPSLVLTDAAKRSEIERAYHKVGPMFWGPRTPLDEACDVVRAWVKLLRA